MPTPDFPVVDGGGLPAGRDGTGAPRRRTAIRVLALGSTVLTALLITVGGVVRATGSGLGCPGWPKCFGRWIPPLEYHAIIEYTHRLITSMDVLVIGAFAVFATAFFRRQRRVLLPAVAALVVVMAQAALGAVVVKGELEAVLVTAHFSTAMILLGVLTYGSVAAFSLDAVVTPEGTPLTTLARLVAGALFALLVLGAFVRGEGASLAFFDWPLMNGRVVPPIDSFPDALHFLHRLGAVVVGLLVAYLAYRSRKAPAMSKAVVLLATAMLGAFVAQVRVGAANVWSRLAPAAVAAHVALAGVVWALAVATAASTRLRVIRVMPVAAPTPELVVQR